MKWNWAAALGVGVIVAMAAPVVQAYSICGV